MKYSVLLLVLLAACSRQKESPKIRKIVDYDELQMVIEENKDKLLVVNFWATWCQPCVEELPHFMEVNDAFKNDEDYKMILISLDKSDQINKNVAKIAEKLNLDTDIYILSDNKRMNEWIPAIDSAWSGAIPATVFYKDGIQLDFTEGQLTKQELTTKINTYIK
ncbi:TlpA family protein disulfide reductase [Bacteroidia bacterium]|nr:TlpA family protein disulfide reductase [Bacteroidia bacterium]